MYSQKPLCEVQDWHLVWSSAAAAHLLHGLTCAELPLPFYHLKPVCPFSGISVTFLSMHLLLIGA